MDQPLGGYRRVRAQNRRSATRTIPRPRGRTSKSAKFPDCQAWRGSTRVGLPARRSELEQETKPARLVVYVGETRISRKGCSLPPGNDGAWGPRRGQRTISAGAGSVEARFPKAAFRQ